ncbi:hypothetical protein [Sphingomonas bacterium]|uniref:hypothetical protein n=1 Tax=Sphingomonas bacterium TaxID=1895847 RepID=UPI001575C9F8|nr:hypothetical protein [Sphingomonas bacterium]
MTRKNLIVVRSLALSTALAVLGLTAAPVWARPGTPNGEASWSPAPGTVAVRWQNTANEGHIVFDIEGQTDASVANWTPGNVGMGSIVTYTFTGLQPGRHCFRIWSRVGAQGLRSDQPSAFTCANVGTPASYAVNHGPTSAPTTTPTPAPTPVKPCKGLVCGGSGGLTSRRN